MSVTDYLNPPPLPKAALTPNSAPSDTAGVVEILRLITNPAVHKKHLDEEQRIRSEWAALARAQRELRRERVLQEQELERIRADQLAALAVDRENHLSALRQREQKLDARLAEFEQIMAGAAGGADG